MTGLASGAKLAHRAPEGHSLLLVLAIELGADHRGEEATQIEGLKERFGQRVAWT